MKLRKPIGVNLKKIAGYSLVGGLSKPDFLLVGATSWSRLGNQEINGMNAIKAFPQINGMNAIRAFPKSTV